MSAAFFAPFARWSRCGSKSIKEVTLVLVTSEEAANGAAAEKPIWEVAADLVRDIPEDMLSSVPANGAAQHDHYLYGAPKRD